MRRIALMEKSFQQSLAAKAAEEINPALEVAAVEFRDYQGQLLGVLITPWFMGLILLPVEIEGWRDHQTGDEHRESLPAGDFQFIHNWDVQFGAYGSCPLFSPMDEFPDQDTALRMAHRTMEKLFETPAKAEAVEVVSEPYVQEQDSAETRAADRVDADREENRNPEEAGVDQQRRGLFTGSLFGRRGK